MVGTCRGRFWPKTLSSKHGGTRTSENKQATQHCKFGCYNICTTRFRRVAASSPKFGRIAAAWFASFPAGVLPSDCRCDLIGRYGGLGCFHTHCVATRTVCSRRLGVHQSPRSGRQEMGQTAAVHCRTDCRAPPRYEAIAQARRASYADALSSRAFLVNPSVIVSCPRVVKICAACLSTPKQSRCRFVRSPSRRKDCIQDLNPSLALA